MLVIMECAVVLLRYWNSAFQLVLRNCHDMGRIPRMVETIHGRKARHDSCIGTSAVRRSVLYGSCAQSLMSTCIMQC
jgi:hypothetical protein